MSGVENAMKSAKSCWTCKRRKIGCDKALPSCSNCRRTGRICQGYGMKLAWPEDGDGRRADPTTCGRSSDTNPFYLTSESSHGFAYFLNTSPEDLRDDVKKHLPSSATARWHFQFESSILFNPSASLNFGYETTLQEQDSSLLSYYTNVLSRMVTTVDDADNGFRTMLIPIALSETNSASSGLRQAMFALSAYHLWGHDAAVKYKLAAIRHLSKSLQDGENAAIPQFATSMMLCIGDVFDSADGSWAKHLAAAKALSDRFPRNGDHVKDLLFLQTLLEYHDVLKGFSAGRHLLSETESMDSLKSEPVLRENSQDTIIIGALGCSRELMDLIAAITRLHKLTSLPDPLHTLPSQIQTRLQDLIQNPFLHPDAQSGELDTTRISQTAELYRLATLIYLHTTLLPLPRSSSQLQSLVSRSLESLEAFTVCTSPWPLFVTALEVDNDKDRLRILRVLETMQRVRRIGNVEMLQGIIEAVWNRIDLMSNGGEQDNERVDWREIFDMHCRLPSFI